MNLPLNRPSIRPKYHDWVFRLFIAIPVAFYMMLYREEVRWYEALDSGSFWLGLAFSYLTCLLLLWLINRLSYRLDSWYQWRNDTLLRLLYQFALGFAAPAALTILLVSAFFHMIFGLDIQDTEYFSDDYPLVVLLILMGNLYYLVYYLWIVPHPGYVPVAEVIDYLE